MLPGAKQEDILINAGHNDLAKDRVTFEKRRSFRVRIKDGR
jgi:hypothetical protein